MTEDNRADSPCSKFMIVIVSVSICPNHLKALRVDYKMCQWSPCHVSVYGSLKACWQHSCINIYTCIWIAGADFTDAVFSHFFFSKHAFSNPSLFATSSFCQIAKLYNCTWSSVAVTQFVHAHIQYEYTSGIAILCFHECTHTHTHTHGLVLRTAMNQMLSSLPQRGWGLLDELACEKYWIEKCKFPLPGSSRCLSPAVIAALISLSVSDLLVETALSI